MHKLYLTCGKKTLAPAHIVLISTFKKIKKKKFKGLDFVVLLWSAI